MKTISKRFLKGGLAILLAVIMLFSSCITGFAAVVDNADTKANVDVAETSATTRYIYVGISNNYQSYKNNSQYGFNFWGGSNGGVKSGTYLSEYTWDGRKYYMYRVEVSDDNNKAQFKGNNSWWDPSNGFTVKLNGTTNNAVFFSHQNDGWQGQFQQNYQETSTGKLTASSSSVKAGTAVTLTPSLASNATYNEVKSTTYKISPTSGASISGNTFTATAAGTYTVTATITYNPKYFTDITKTCTATTTITVTQPKYSYTVTAGAGGTVTPASGEVNQGSSVSIIATPSTGYDFDGWEVTDGTVTDADSATTTFTPSANGANANATFTKSKYTVTASASPAAGGTVTVATSPVEHGGSTNITATANPGYTFSGWTKSGNGTFGDATAASTTYAPTSNSVLTATFTQNKYSITVNETGGTGTVVLSKSSNITYGEEVTITVTPPATYKISTISGGGLSGSNLTSYTDIITVTDNVTINIAYVLAGTCAPEFTYGIVDPQLVIGGTYQNSAKKNEYCTGNGTFTYTSSDDDVATVSADGTVTALSPGTTTITAECNTHHTTTSYPVTVKTPSLSFDDVTLDVNGTVTAAPSSVADAPASYTIKYAKVTAADKTINVSENGVITAVMPDTTQVKATLYYGNDPVVEKTFSVTVKTPAFTLKPAMQELIIGQTSTVDFVTTSTPAAKSVTITGDDKASVSGTKATALAEGTATITAAFKYNDSYTAYATVGVMVSAPVIEADKPDVALEYYAEDNKYNHTATVTLSTNAEFGNGTGDDITLEYDADVVDVVLNDDNTLSITSKKVGATDIVAKFHDAKVTIPVTVTTYDPYNYFYFTNNWAWTDCYAHIYVEGGSASYDLTKNAYHLVKIGKNQDGQDVYAGRILKTQANATHIIFSQSAGTWPSNYYRTNGIAFNFSQYNAFYCSTRTSDEKITVGTWTFVDSTPTVSVENLTINVGDTGTLTATQTGAYTPSSYSWSSDNNNVSFGTVSGNTVPVTGDTAGTSEVTVRAFAYTSTATADKTSLKSLYTTSEDAWPYISSTATATVTVTDVLYDVDVKAEFSNDGTTYTEGTTGGTVIATIDGVQQESPFTISHGKQFNLKAEANEGYRFVGWSVNGGEVQSYSPNPVDVTVYENKTYVAHFVKTYNVQVVLPEGFTSVTYGTVTNTETLNTKANAGTTFTVSAEASDDFIQTGWQVAYANGTPDTVTDLTFTVDSLQSDVVLTPTCAAAHTAHAEIYTNKQATGAFGGNNVTINGEASPAKGQEGDTLEYEAHPGANFTFFGWYSDSTFETLVSEDATYTTTMPADGVTLYALFARNLYLASGEDKVEFTYNVATDTYTLSSAFVETFTIADNEANVNFNVVNVTDGTYTGATVAGDYTAYTFTANTVDYDTTKNVTYVMTPDGDGSYTLNATLVAKPRFNVSFNGEGVGNYAVGAPVEIDAAPMAGYYLAGASSDPAVNGLAFDSETGLITFTMPENHVDVTATYAQLAQINFNETVGLVFTGTNSNGYYVPGNEYVITVAPQSDKVTILGMTANGGTVTNDGDTYTLTVTPTDGQIIDVTLTVDAKFTMDYGVKSIGDFGTGSTATQYGTVTMTKADDTEITNADLVEKTDTITYTAEAGDNYIFDGWYSDPTCSILNIITRESTYEVTPTADTTVYALFVRKQYIDLDSNTSSTGTDDQYPMKYDPKTRSFSYTTPDNYSRSAWFRISNDNTSVSAWTDTTSYSDFSGVSAGSFSVTFNATGYNAYVGWGTKCFELQHSADESDEADGGKTPGSAPFEILLRINENNAIDVSARAKKTDITAYLSYGRGDVVPATSTVTDNTGLTVSSVKKAYNAINADVYEKYVTVTSSSDYALSFQTQLTGDTAADYYIDKFVVYHMNTRTYTIVDPNPLGNNTYSGSVYVDSDCYIVPIFFHTEEYCAANDLVEIDVYFDATAVDMNTWGPFVSCYTYGANTSGVGETRYCGGWPGQLMIPTEDGSSFYTMITVPKADAENPTSTPQGILFSNYMQASVVTDNAGAFGVYNEQQQTYDYREAITLYNAGVEVITFTAKNSTDGYHGDSSSVNNYNTLNTVSASKTDLSKYTFDYLYNRDGVTPMDFYADDITNPKNIDTTGADYYVITRGDVPYGKYGLNGESNSLRQGATYAADENFSGEWCVEWYIFDKDGNFLTKVLSDALFNDGLDEDTVPYLVEELAAAQGVSEASIAGKTVAISYEAPNNDKNNTHQVSYDGQWYGNMLSDFVHGNVIVGLEDENGKFNLDTDEEDHIADYGQGYLIDENGDKWGDLNITMDYGEADLSATPAEGYYFVGWYTYVRGEYVRISPSPEYNAYINMNTTYYAIFKEIGPGEVVINHLLYNNPDDPYIPSHGGAANMLVEVYNNTTGDVVQKGVISNSVSTVVFKGEAGIDYRIDITTTPLMGGSFYAWYTDSEDENGNATYEEILTTEEVVGSETTVESSFYYEYTETSQRLINIYSDIKRVSSYADIVYKYYNRNGEVRTYTVKDVPLTDEECNGYAGTTLNNVTYQYCPTFVTMYEYVHTTSGDVKYSQVEDNAELKAQGYLPNDTYNRIQELAPRAAVTEAIDEIVSWTVDEVNLEIDKSYVVVWADQKDIEFTITAITPDGAEIAKKSGPYNTLATDIEAPKTFEGKEFSYWIDAETGEILSYLIEYNYRIVEDKTIMAMYGKEVEKWTPVIDSVTYTREYQDTSDYVYSDFLITFNSSEDQELDVMKANGEDVKYGLIMVRDKNYKYEGSNTTLDPVTYPNAGDINDESKRIEIASEILRTGKNYGYDVDLNGDGVIEEGKDTRYLAYHYDLTSYESTNFNRMEYYLRYNNYVLNNRKYAFKAYVYLVADGVTYVSEPVDVNIYDAATAPVEQ